MHVHTSIPTCHLPSPQTPKPPAFTQGIGTAIGELPPYFMARAARLSGEVPDDEDMEEFHEHLKTSEEELNNSYMGRAKVGWCALQLSHCLHNNKPISRPLSPAFHVSSCAARGLLWHPPLRRHPQSAL